MVKTLALSLSLCLWVVPLARSGERDAPVGRNIKEIPGDVLQDKIRGGLLGQILGNLNGLPHEMKVHPRAGQRVGLHARAAAGCTHGR
jgi:hypothetical protein